MGSGMPTPPRDDHVRPHVARKTTTTSKPMKSAYRSSKRTPASAQAPSSSSAPAAVQLSRADSRHKRVWKACERCRMKKTKCDGEFPCKRCKNDGLVCTAGLRKKTQYKEIPRGYAEVLENSQFALVATIHKLYSMVRSGEPWQLGEPDVNDLGLPVVHTIASRLGCIRPNNDIDVPVHAAFPEDEAGLSELMSQLHAQQHEAGSQPSHDDEHEHENGASCDPDASEPEPEPDHLGGMMDLGLDNMDLHNYRRMAFGETKAFSAGMPSPQSISLDTDLSRPASSGGFPQHPHLGTPLFGGRAGGGSVDGMVTDAALATGLSATAFSPYLFEQTADPFLDAPNDAPMMMGMGDPMMFSGYGPDLLSM